MDRRILIYGAALAILITLLKVVEYKMVVMDHSLELYGGSLAVVFTIIGIIAGRKLTGKKELIVEKIITVHTTTAQPPMPVSEPKEDRWNLSKREHEILQLMAEGYSNQEIADKIFVSVSTVKTHGSNLFMKLDVQRRTQAIKKAKELKIIA